MTRLLPNSFYIITFLCSWAFQENSQSLTPLELGVIIDFEVECIDEGINAIGFVKQEGEHATLAIALHNVLQDRIENIIPIDTGVFLNIIDIETDESYLYLTYTSYEETYGRQSIIKRINTKTNELTSEVASIEYEFSELCKFNDVLFGLGSTIKIIGPAAGDYLINYDSRNFKAYNEVKFRKGFSGNAMAFRAVYDLHLSVFHDTIQIPYWDGEGNIVISRFDKTGSLVGNISLPLIEKDVRVINFVLISSKSGVLHIINNLGERVVRLVKFNSSGVVSIDDFFKTTERLDIELVTPEYIIINQDLLGIRKLNFKPFSSEVLFKREEYYLMTELIHSPDGRIYYYTFDRVKEDEAKNDYHLNYQRLK